MERGYRSLWCGTSLPVVQWLLYTLYQSSIVHMCRPWQLCLKYVTAIPIIMLHDHYAVVPHAMLNYVMDLTFDPWDSKWNMAACCSESVSDSEKQQT